MALDTSEWLVWLGVKEPQVDLSVIQADIERLKDSVGEWDDFEADVTGSVDYADLEQKLINGGFSSAKVDNFISKIQQRFTSFSDFQDNVDNELDSFDEFRSEFGNTQGLTGSKNTEDGEPAGGIRVHDSAGTSYSGVDVPAGTTEVFGTRIEFSQQGGAVDRQEVTYANLTTDDADNTVKRGSTIQVSADVTNPNTYGLSATVPLKLDGDVEQAKQVRLGSGETRTVSFDVRKVEYVCYDASIGTTGSVTLCWSPANVGVGL